MGGEANVYLKHPSVIAACCFFIAFDHVQIGEKNWAIFIFK